MSSLLPHDLCHGRSASLWPPTPCLWSCFLTCIQISQEADQVVWYLLGARVRYSTRDKGHEEGGSTYAKAGSSLRSPPGNPRASTPITRPCLLYYFVLIYTSDFTGPVPPTSFGEGVNLELQLIKTPGRDKSVLTYKLL